jgi:hypothetical protein
MVNPKLIRETGRMHVPIIRDGEPRTLTNRANAHTECLAAPSLKRTGGVKASRN